MSSILTVKAELADVLAATKSLRKAPVIVEPTGTTTLVNRKAILASAFVEVRLLFMFTPVASCSESSVPVATCKSRQVVVVVELVEVEAEVELVLEDVLEIEVD